VILVEQAPVITVDAERTVSDRVEVLARDQVRRAGVTIENRWPLRP
jgi:hypothetical protein